MTSPESIQRRCRFCDAPLPDGGEIIHGFAGRFCHNCARPKSYSDAASIYKAVADTFRELTLPVPRHRLMLMTGRQLKDAYFDTEGVTPRGTSRPDGAGSYIVELLSQQSEVSLAATMAHELTHLSLFQAGITAKGDYVEGFCNLVAFLATLKVNRDGAAVHLTKMMCDTSAGYGTHFLELKVIHELSGWEAVTRYFLQKIRP